MKNVILSVRAEEEYSVKAPSLFLAVMTSEFILFTNDIAETLEENESREISVPSFGIWVPSRPSTSKIMAIRDCDTGFKIHAQSLLPLRAKIKSVSVRIYPKHCYFTSYEKGLQWQLKTNIIPLRALHEPDPFIALD